MLRPNPQQRMGVEQVLEHPWFLTDLPEGALTMNSWYLDHVASLEDVSWLTMAGFCRALQQTILDGLPYSVRESARYRRDAVRAASPEDS